MKKVIIFIIILVIFSLRLVAQWSWLSPDPQGNNLNTIQLLNENVGLIAGDCETLLKTSDGGQSWNVIESSISGNITDIYFFDEFTGFAISNDLNDCATVYKTVNGGISWDHTVLQSTNAVLSIIFLNNSYGFITGAHGLLFKTTDGGINWVEQNIETEYKINSVFFVNPDIGFAASEFGLIYKTQDGGESWFPFSTGYSNENKSLFFLNENTGFVVGSNNYILKTVDGGVNWTPPILDIIEGYSIYFFNENNGIIGCSNGDIYETSNGGSNWTHSPYNDITTLNDLSFINEMDGICVGVNGDILKTNDGGVSWSHNSFTTQADLNDITFISDSIALTGTSSGTILKTTDQGSTWEINTYAVNGKITKLLFPSDSTGYLISSLDESNQLLYKSIDQGESWNIIESHNRDVISDIFFIDDDSGYLTSMNEILHTEDGGITWSSYISYPEINFNKLAFPDSDTGYVTASYNYTMDIIYKTTNGGQTWEQNHIAQFNIVSILAISIDTVYALTLYAGILKTIDGGERWIYSGALSEAGAFVSTRLHFTSNNAGYFLGIPGEMGKGIVLKTNDGGITWHESLRTSALLNSICFTRANDTGIIVGEHGSILKTSNAGGTVYIKKIKKEIIKIGIFPNPSSDYIRICIPELYSGKTTYYIRNNEGRILDKKDILLDESNKLSILNYPPGIYLITMIFPDGNWASGKFVVL